MGNLDKYLIVKLYFCSNMTSQKEAVVTAITEWNKLYSKYYDKEILMSEEAMNTQDFNRDLEVKMQNTVDVTLYLFDNINKDKVMNITYESSALEILTGKSSVFFEYQVKNKAIIKDLKLLIEEKIGEVENTLSEYSTFNIFKNLNKDNLLLLMFAADTHNVYFYPTWVSKQSISLLEKWKTKNGFSFENSIYETAVSNLSDLNLLEVVEFTEYGNPRLYRLPYKVLKHFKSYREISV